MSENKLLPFNHKFLPCRDALSGVFRNQEGSTDHLIIRELADPRWNYVEVVMGSSVEVVVQTLAQHT